MQISRIKEKEEGGKLIPTVHFHGNNCGKLPIGEGYNHVLYVVSIQALVCEKGATHPTTFI